MRAGRGERGVYEAPRTNGHSSKDDNKGHEDADNGPYKRVFVVEGDVEVVLDADFVSRPQDDDLCEYCKFRQVVE